MSGLPFWELPQTLCIGGECVTINTDFRAGIRVRQMWWDPYFRQRGGLLLRYSAQILFGEARAQEICEREDAASVMLWYLLDGRVPRSVIERQMHASADADLPGGAAAADEACMGMSYLWDMPLISASFRQVYGISLASAEMHLWEFDALLGALPADCALCRVIAARTADLSLISDDTQRAAAAAERVRLRLPSAQMLLDVYNDLHLCTKDKV